MLIITVLQGVNPIHNLLFERSILEKYEKDESNVYLIFYENQCSIILGKTLKYENELYSFKEHPLVLRRGSGGGSVFHFYGNLNFGIIASETYFSEIRSISDSYTFFLEPIARVYQADFSVSLEGTSDLVVLQSGLKKKISGNAQMRKKKWVLHHGTLLYDSASLEYCRLPYYLRHPSKKPEYRKERSHEDFIVKKLPSFSKKKIINRVIKHWKQKLNTNKISYVEKSYEETFFAIKELGFLEKISTESESSVLCI